MRGRLLFVPRVAPWTPYRGSAPFGEARRSARRRSGVRPASKKPGRSRGEACWSRETRPSRLALFRRLSAGSREVSTSWTHAGSLWGYAVLLQTWGYDPASCPSRPKTITERQPNEKVDTYPTITGTGAAWCRQSFSWRRRPRIGPPALLRLEDRLHPHVIARSAGARSPGARSAHRWSVAALALALCASVALLLLPTYTQGYESSQTDATGRVTHSSASSSKRLFEAEGFGDCDPAGRGHRHCRCSGAAQAPPQDPDGENGRGPHAPADPPNRLLHDWRLLPAQRRRHVHRSDPISIR